MQILQGRSARSDLPMSNTARKQFGIQPEVIRNIDKNEVLPTNDLHIGQSVMYQDSVTKQWHPAVIVTQQICVHILHASYGPYWAYTVCNCCILYQF